MHSSTPQAPYRQQPFTHHISLLMDRSSTYRDIGKGEEERVRKRRGAELKKR